jgi:hypothetical protein
VTQLPDLSHLSHAAKDALIHALWAQVRSLTASVAALEAKLNEPSKNPDNSSLPPSKGQKPTKPEKAKRIGPRLGSLGRKGGGRTLVRDKDETATAKPAACVHCQAALTDADQVLHGRYDKTDLPVVRPMVTRVARSSAPDQRGRFGCDAAACQTLFRQRGRGQPCSQVSHGLLAFRHFVSDGRGTGSKPDPTAALADRLLRRDFRGIDGRTHWNWAEGFRMARG